MQLTVLAWILEGGNLARDNLEIPVNLLLYLMQSRFAGGPNLKVFALPRRYDPWVLLYCSLAKKPKEKLTKIGKTF